MLLAMVVQPRAGSGREVVRDALAQVSAEIFNVRGAGSPLLDRYIRWANSAARVLGRLISADDLDRLVLTKRYWLLQSMTVESGTVRELVTVEIDERVRELDEAHKSLTEQIDHWSRAGVFAVADTSVYIESANKLEELDVGGLLVSREAPVHLLIPIIVIDELDGLKRSRDRPVRWRAGYTLAVIDRLLTSGTGTAVLRSRDYSALDTGGIPRGEVTIEIVFDLVAHVRLPINDDEIVDRILAIQALAGRPVTLLTFDTGQSTRARAAGLPVVKLTAADFDGSSAAST